jgi:hypothetical protein
VPVKQGSRADRTEVAANPGSAATKGARRGREGGANLSASASHAGRHTVRREAGRG